ncbi:MAG: hypothetical protein ACREEP_14820 [Dongiaceae bacterium]
MPFPNNAPDWRDLWADLLQGVGRGLLELDGSRTAQAALAGLDTFEAAREHRLAEGDVAKHVQEQIDRLYPGLELSAEEWAHLLRVTPTERLSWLQEMADADHPGGAQTDGGDEPRARGGGRVSSNSAPTSPGLSPYRRVQPVSANPYDGWSMASGLPLAPDGQLTIPSFRR